MTHFSLLLNLCSHEVSPSKIANLIYWRPDRVFFELEGIHSPDEFTKLAGDKFDQNRWYCKDGELIVHNGKTYAFSSKWGIRWKQAVNIFKKEFPEANIEYRVTQENAEI